jgi:hypothetical protein
LGTIATTLRRVVEIINSLLGLAPIPHAETCDREFGVWLLPAAPARLQPRPAEPVVVPPPAPGCGSDGWELEAPLDALRAALKSPLTPKAQRSIALAEIVERGDSSLARYIADTLASETVDREWAGELVFAADRLREVDDDARPALAEAVKKQALQLREDPDASAAPVLWAALRTAARQVRSVDAAFFAAFLQGGDSTLTRQAALQALQTVFARDGGTPAEPVAERLEELCQKYLDPDFLTNGANRALAANAYVATVLMAPASTRTVALTDRVLDVGGEALRRIVVLALRDAHVPMREDVRGILTRLEAAR